MIKFESFIKKTEKSETLLINELSIKKVKEGKQLYQFGFGQSPFLPPKHVIDHLKRKPKYTKIAEIKYLY